MPILAETFAVLAALLHVLFFAMESVLWPRPDVWGRFGIRSQSDADVVRPMAFNQGFYNLFLAAGVVVGVIMVSNGAETAGRAVVVFGCAVMVGAGAVLLATARRFAVAAAVQAGPPLLAILVTLLA
jgi:putative membrane protein